MYRGEMKRGRREGKGTILYIGTPFVSYEGDWVDDQKHGMARQLYRNGNLYDGSFRDDQRNGYGRLKYVNGDSYAGAWVNDVKHGSGIFCWSEAGTRYEGQFQDGMMHGRGKYTFADGTVFEGSYDRGHRKGQGVLIAPDGARESGEWVGGERQPSHKEREEARHAAPDFRPDLAIKVDPGKRYIEKMLQLEDAMEELEKAAVLEREAEGPTGASEDWDELSAV